MITHSNAAAQQEKKQHGFDLGALLYRVGRVLFVVVLFVLFFLLAEAMAHHRFFEGGWYNPNGTIRP
jgi:hypothetical protein